MGFADHIERVDRTILGQQVGLGPVTAQYQPAVGGPVDVSGIFDSHPGGVAQSLAGVAYTSPTFWCRVSDLQENPTDRDDQPQLTIDGTDYAAYEANVDDMGGCLLLLREVTA